MSSGRFPAVPASASEGGEPEVRYWIRFGKREIPVEPGETLIGRGEGCHILINENLVSRRHARVVYDGARLYVEDLGSANGTFVNQERLYGRKPLFPGDHIFVGTCEVDVFERVEEDRPTVPLAPPEPPRRRHTPPSGVGRFESASSSARASQVPSSGQRAPRGGDAPPADTTTEVDAFEYLGRLADKMFTMGRVDAAQRILSSHLEEILEAARSGRTLDAALVDSAGHYAVKLANETLDGRWVDTAIELHHIASRPLREETIQQLASLRAKAPLGDDALIAKYYTRLRSNLARMTAAERVLCERIVCLLPGLGSGD
jgi:hypothetical protein